MKKKKNLTCLHFSSASVSLLHSVQRSLFIKRAKIHFTVYVSIENSCEFSRVSVSFSTFRAVDVLVS